jgi:hypothetical protein
MQIEATILVDGLPLRWAYVEHIVLSVGTEMYITDAEGRIRNTDFDPGIESFTANADIRIICQNPIVRVLDGGALNIGVYQDKSGITDNTTINLNTLAEQRLHYRILNLAQITYEVAFKPLSFFQDLPDPNFPLGRKASLRDTRDQAKRIDLSFPDGVPNPSTFVEPKRLGDDFPLMHIKERTNAFDAGRLFGDDGALPTLIPSELSHALHFSFLSKAQREQAQDKYLQFIASDIVSGGSGTHGFAVPTTPEVAYIEALDLYSVRFTEFMRQRQGGVFLVAEAVTPALRAEFVRAQWLLVTTISIPQLPNLNLGPLGGGGGAIGLAIGSLFFRLTRLFRRATVTGADVEGAIFGAIFVDFAGFVGLNFAASSYFAANALTFGQYRTFINDKHPEHAASLELVRRFWGL